MHLVSASNRLANFLRELERLRQSNPLQNEHFLAVSIQLANAARGLSLIHGALDHPSLLAILRAGSLQCPDRLGKRGSAAAQRGGTTQYVCTSAGRLYPKRNVAFIFRQACEHGQTVEATPFDSGRFLGGKLSPTGTTDQELKEAFDSFTLPAPMYRELMSALVLSLYSDVEQYVRGNPQRFTAPAEFPIDSKLGLRFEVRFLSELSLSNHLDAIILKGERDDAMLLELHKALDLVEKRGVSVYYCSADLDVEQGAAQHIVSSLAGAQGLLAQGKRDLQW